jgi:hypothetical protein
MSDDISEGDMLRLQSASAADPQTKLNVDSNRVFLAGTQQYVDFEASIDRLKAADVTSADLLSQAMELDDPAKVLHHLGQEDNLDTAKMIAKMTPVKRAAALAALERGEPISNNAAVPMWKRSRADLSNESLSDKEWGRAWDRKYLGRR